MVDVNKDEDAETPIPTIWRSAICLIVDKLKSNNFSSSQLPSNIEPVSEETLDRIYRTVRYYGDDLISLPEESWMSSVSIWMCGYWDVAVDLYTYKEGRSDLVLFLRVNEEGESYRFIVDSVHVP